MFREFEKTVGEKWKSVQQDAFIEVKSMQDDLTKYQNPKEADTMMKIQSDLDEIKDIMHRNIEQVNFFVLSRTSEQFSPNGYGIAFQKKCTPFHTKRRDLMKYLLVCALKNRWTILPLNVGQI